MQEAFEEDLQGFWNKGLQHRPSRKEFKPHSSLEPLAVFAGWYGLVTRCTLSFTFLCWLALVGPLYPRDICQSLKHQFSWLNHQALDQVLDKTPLSVVILAQGLAACSVLCRMQRTGGYPGASQTLGQFEEPSSLGVSRISQWSSCFELLACCSPWIIKEIQ